MRDKKYLFIFQVTINPTLAIHFQFANSEILCLATPFFVVVVVVVLLLTKTIEFWILMKKQKYKQ